MDDDEGVEMRWCLRAGKKIHTEKVAKLFEVACNLECGYWLHHNHQHISPFSHTVSINQDTNCSLLSGASKIPPFLCGTASCIARFWGISPYASHFWT
jgi:hypothetical protein